MSTTSKAFSYVFNSLKEDHKVSKVLSGWKSIEFVPLADLSLFDAQAKAGIREVQAMLFATCQSFSEKKYNINQRVLDVLTAYLVLHFPILKDASPNGPAVKHLETCVLESGRTLADLLAWSTTLATFPCAKKHKKTKKHYQRIQAQSPKNASSFTIKLLSLIILSDIQDAKTSAWMR